jgi:DNA repair exonuclease SbcCD ATPase subunit
VSRNNTTRPDTITITTANQHNMNGEANGRRMLLNGFTRDELVAKIEELELVLEEFQESSKDLELALEMELQELELANSLLKKTLTKTQAELDETNTKVLSLTRELSECHEARAQENTKTTAQLNHLQQQVISMEITNDNMENHDRILTNKLHLANQLNNELLERIALIESDLEREKSTNVANRLYITNYQNQVKELTEKLDSVLAADESNADESNADESTISISKILRDAPPTDQPLLEPPQQPSPALKMIRSISSDLRYYLNRSQLENNKGGTDDILGFGCGSARPSTPPKAQLTPIAGSPVRKT